MDYDIINQVISELVDIVNNYNRKRGYNTFLMEDLLVVLLGYYLVFGSEIFKRIDAVLESLRIHVSYTDDDFRDILKDILPNMFVKGKEVTPLMVYDYKYRKDGKLLGAVPNIILVSRIRKGRVFDLAHELSHTIEGTSAEILWEDREDFEFSEGFSTFSINKHDGFGPIRNSMFTELITSCIESRIANALKELDPEKIDNEFVSWFVEYIKDTDRKVVTGSYLFPEMIYKDLFDNEVFFEMIKKYHYQNEHELWEEDFNSYTGGKVRLKELVNLADMLDPLDPIQTMKYQAIIQEKIRVFNQATNCKTSSSLILMI